MTGGEESQVSQSVGDGRLVFHLSPSGDTVPAYYLYNANFANTDVQVDVETTNLGNNANAVILVCQHTENGWYEFNISNSGTYSIYAFDETGAVQQGYNELSTGNSSCLKAGLSTNVYTAVCMGNELSLYVNGELVDSIVETTFNFVEGNIGFGVWAVEVLPVDLSIDSLTVSAP